MDRYSIEDRELLKAIRDADINRARSLLEEGVDPNETDKDGATALHYAAIFEDSGEIAKLLVEKYGANLEATEKLGITPLRYALARKNLPVLNFLIEKGAAVDRKDDAGKTVMDWVDTYHLRDVVNNAVALRQQNIQDIEAKQKIAEFHDTAVKKQTILKNLRPKVRLMP
jgi:ankyrin repeat protein